MANNISLPQRGYWAILATWDILRTDCDERATLTMMIWQTISKQKDC